MTAGDPIRPILRSQIETLRQANRELHDANMRLLNERDALLIEVERMRLNSEDEVLWKQYDEPDRADYNRWFWTGYGIALIALGLAMLITLWLVW